MGYKTIIGLEIHTELMTNTKMFCGCINFFGGEANTHCCPVCLGLPGAMPRLNKQAIEFAIRSGIAFNSKINRETRMDRKNYFYVDLPKGYQTSQDDIPLCQGGYVDIELDGKEVKRINLERIHIEEDTGKLTHTLEGDTLIDYNRAGVPLIEIVTEPEMNTAEEARRFLEDLRERLKYIEVSDCRMEEGSLRCDVNINIVDVETGARTNISEIKNLNSFRAAVRAIEYEEKRHIDLLKQGKNTTSDTRRWDEAEGKTIPMREKGESEYRYASDGSIPPIEIHPQWIEEIKRNIPELPHDKKERFVKEYNLSEYDAGVLTGSKNISIFFEETMEYINDSRLVSNWITGDVLRRLNDEELEIEDTPLTPKALGQLISIVKEGKINNNTGKKVLREVFETGKDPETIVKEKGLIQISDAGELEEMIKKILDENEQSIIDFKSGKDRALGFLVGQVMKASRGKANPQIVNKMVSEMLNKR